MKAFYRNVFEESGQEDTNSLEEAGRDGDGGEEDSGEKPLPTAPVGAEALQKASAWYFVSHSEETNIYIREAKREWRGQGGVRKAWTGRALAAAVLKFPVGVRLRASVCYKEEHGGQN